MLFSSYHGYSALEGGLMDLGPDPVPREPLDTRYNVHHGDRSDSRLYDYLMRASEQYDVNSPDLDEFVSNGG